MNRISSRSALRRPGSKRRPRCPLGVEALEHRELLSGNPIPIAPSDAFANVTSDNVAAQDGHNYANSQVEPSVAVNPHDSKNIVSVWQQDRWSNGAARGFQGGVSTDGGKTWTQIVIPGISQVTGGTDARATDPWVSFSPDGTVFCNSLAYDPFTGVASVQVSKSTDGGFNWGAPIVVNTDGTPTVSGDLTTYPFNDKETLTADPTNSQYVYTVWVQFRDTFDGQGNFLYEDGLTLMSRSTDGGATWGPTTTVNDPLPNPQVGDVSDNQGNQILVRPNGSLVDLFENLCWDPGIQSYRLTVQAVTSTDHGATWSAPYTVAQVDQGYADRWTYFSAVADPDHPDTPVRTADIIPGYAVDPKNGNLYAAWQDGPHGNGSSSPSVVQLAMSSDGGKTWTAPVQANRTPTNLPTLDQQAFNPAVAVNNNGTVAITYDDFRNNTAAAGVPTDVWAITVDPSGKGGLANPKNWGNEIRLTPQSFDMELAPQTEGLGYFIGDYQGLAAVNGNKFLAVFIEAGTAGPGTSSAFAVQFSPGDKGNGPGDKGNDPSGNGRSDYLFLNDPTLDDSLPWMHKKRRGAL